MPKQLSLSLLRTPGPKVAVVSHERSGTHFLMNSVAENFGYNVKPWLNFDFDLGLNFYSPQNLSQFFRQFRQQPVANILKSHHSFDFFAPVIDEFLGEFKVLYIYRDPRDALISNWKLINSFEWDEGPKVETPAEFIFAEPSGAMMRFQKYNEETMLARWETHVNGWLGFIENHQGGGIKAIKYEDMNANFDKTVKSLGKFLGNRIKSPVRPDKDKNVIGSGQGITGAYRKHLTAEDNERIVKAVGNSMERWGFDISY